MAEQLTAVALIPARSGSKRAAGKNIRFIAGHPLLAYTIRAAIDSGCFSGVYVSSDSPEYCTVAADYGATPILRPACYAGDLSPDVEWVSHALDELGGRIPNNGTVRDFHRWDLFSILRPTSPFRKPDTIRRAFAEFQPDSFDSLRALEPVTQHPAKMWTVLDGTAWPYSTAFGAHAHSLPYQALPPVWAQNASLEIAHTRLLYAPRPSISGDRVQAFLTVGYEGFDINTEVDFLAAEQLIAMGRATLPEVTCQSRR